MSMDKIKSRFKAAHAKARENGEEAEFLLGVIIVTLVGLAALLVAAVLVSLILDVLFWPVIIGGAIYAAGAYFLGWPIPAFAKKFVK